MTWEDGVLLATNGDVGERVTYEKGVLTIGRFRRVGAKDGEVWVLDHVFTLSERSTAIATALLADHMVRARCIAQEVAEERLRQELRFPTEERGLPDGTGGGGRETYRAIAQASCDRAQREGRLTNAHIFEEEAMEVLAETDRHKLRVELLQTAATAFRWIEEIDREIA